VFTKVESQDFEEEDFEEVTRGGNEPKVIDDVSDSNSKKEELSRNLDEQKKAIENISVLDIRDPKNAFDPRLLKLMFLSMFVINAFDNQDHGAIPSATQLLKQDLHLNNEQLGSLGSLVFFGLTLGSLIATFAFNSSLSNKQILILSYFGNGMGLVLFGISTNYWL